MRLSAFALSFLVSAGLARKEHRKIQEHQGRGDVRSLASLLFAGHPGVVGSRSRSAIGEPALKAHHDQDSTRQKRLRAQVAQMAVGEDESASHQQSQFDELRNKVMSSAMAMALALAPGVASAAPPSLYKVDKTGIIGGAADILEQGIDTLHGILGNYGFSIFCFTVLIKLLTLPLLDAQMQTTTKMQKLSPIQQKIAKSFGPREEQQKNEMLARLFQTANVNPLAGCLPAIVQIPVFISLYRSLTNLIAEDKLEESFLWIPSLEGPVSGDGGISWLLSVFGGDPVWGYDGTAKYLSLSVILFIVQKASISLNQPKRPDPSAPLSEQEVMSKQITTFLPFLLTFFSLSVPAGLSLYWIFNSVLTTTASQALKLRYANVDFPPEVQVIVDQLDARAEGTKGVASKVKVKVNPGAFGAGGSDLQVLPAGWEKAYSEEQSREYYFNRKTGESSWLFPEAGAQEEENDDVSFSTPIEAESVRVAPTKKRKPKKKVKKAKKA